MFSISKGQIVPGAIIAVVLAIGAVLFIFQGLSRSLEGVIDPSPDDMAAAEELCAGAAPFLPSGANWRVSCSFGSFFISVDAFTQESYELAVQEAFSALLGLGINACSPEMAGLVSIQNSIVLLSGAPSPGEGVWDPCG